MKTKNYFLKSLFALILMCYNIETHASTAYSGCTELVFNQNLGTNGAYETLRLEVIFGSVPTDFGWLVVDSNFNLVKGSQPSDFANYSAGDTATFYINFSGIGAGDHNFVAMNQKGLGMNGGAYTVYSSKDNTIIASSGNFTFSEATTFCYYTSNQNGVLDTTAPSNPSNLSVTSTTNNSASLSWIASTDSQQSLIAYYIIVDGQFVDGVYAGSTSYTLHNLTSGVNYNVSVVALDAMSNLSVGTSNVVMINTGNTNNLCSSGSNLELNLNFDANPEHVRWVIKDANYQVVDQRTYYSNQAPNTSISEPISLPTNNTGDYLLQVFDALGNGGTSFTLTDSSGTVVSGTATGFSDAVQFCVGSTSITLDTIKPSAPQNLVVNNISSNNIVDLSWDPATDNIGVTNYAIRSGNTIGNITSNTNYPMGPLLDFTYDFNIICTDAAGNISDASDIETVVIQTSSVTTLHEGFFETGWDNWIDGGQNATRINNVNNAYEGNRAVRLRNGNNTSKITLENLQLEDYDEVELSFIVKSRGMENGEAFYVDYFDGNTWVRAGTFTKGIMYNNNQYSLAIVRLSKGSFNLVNNAKFKIAIAGDENNDRIFVDVTKIKGEKKSSYLAKSIQKPSFEIIPLEKVNDTKKEENSITNGVDIKLYPNPASDYFNFNNMEGLKEVHIYTLDGRLIKTFKDIDPSAVFIIDIKKEMYVVKALYHDEWKTFKLIVK